MGFNLGVPFIDGCGGLDKEDFLLIVSPMVNGKSYLSTYLAYQIAEQLNQAGDNRPILFFPTNGVTDVPVFRWMTIASKGKFSFTEIANRKLTNKKEFFDFIKSENKNVLSSLYVADYAGYLKRYPRAEFNKVKVVKEFIHKHNPALVVVDEIDDFIATDKATGSDDFREQFGDIAMELKELSIDSKIPFIVTQQYLRETVKYKETELTAKIATKTIFMKQLDKNTLIMADKGNPFELSGGMATFRVDFDRGLFQCT